jgi:hypothetical protein
MGFNRQKVEVWASGQLVFQLPVDVVKDLGLPTTGRGRTPEVARHGLYLRVVFEYWVTGYGSYGFYESKYTKILLFTAKSLVVLDVHPR